jgi:hypothetical protein
VLAPGLMPHGSDDVHCLECNAVMTDHEMLVEIVQTMRELKTLGDGIQTQVAPMLEAAKASPILRMMGVV